MLYVLIKESHRQLDFVALDRPLEVHLGKSAAGRLTKPNAQVVRDAIANFHDSIGRLNERERQRQLRVIRELVPSIPSRPLSEVEKEIADVRSARHSSGRATRRVSR